MRRPAALACLLLAACASRAGEPRPATGDLDLAQPRPAPAPAPSSSPDPPAASAPAAPAHPAARRPIRRGRLIDIDLKDADLHNVFRLIADAGGVNIAVAGDVRGTVTVRLRQVPWDQALETIVALEKLTLERHGDVYLITR